jgi:hypothetical protein
MTPLMLCHPMRRVTMLPHLSGPLRIVSYRLHGLAILGLGPITDGELGITKVIAHPITGEDLRRHQSGADIPAVIPQNKFVKASFLRGPVLARRNQDRPARRSGRSAKNKGVDALAVEHLHIRHLPRIFLHDDRREGASGESYEQKRTSEEFRAHNNEVERTPAF